MCRALLNSLHSSEIWQKVFRRCHKCVGFCQLHCIRLGEGGDGGGGGGGRREANSVQNES